jgi:hypothetical protein
MKTGRVDLSLNGVTPWLVLTVRHFAEPEAAILGSLPLLSVASGWQASCTLLWRRPSTGRRTRVCIINETPEIRFHRTTTLTPEQFVAGLTDFGPGRSTLFGNSADECLKVHYLRRSEADVTEGSLGIWERLYYDWSDPDQVVLTTTDSNVWESGSGYTYTFKRQPSGSTGIHVVLVREGKNFKGQVLGFVLRTVGRRILEKAFEKSVKAIEARYGLGNLTNHQIKLTITKQAVRSS